jgi:hypothetical protein
MATPPDFTAGQILTAAQMNAVGLWEISSTTFSAVSSHAVNDCFSADYDSYRVIFLCSRSTTNQVTMRLRVGVTDNTDAVYGTQIVRAQATTLTGVAANNTSLTFNNTTDSQSMSAVFDIHNPFIAAHTLLQGQSSQGMYATNSQSSTFWMRHESTAAFTGMNFIASTGTITGTCQVYGYRD